MKKLLRNIANRPIPVSGVIVVPGDCCEVEVTEEVQHKINNKFFEDLGIVKPAELKVEKEEEKATEDVCYNEDVVFVEPQPEMEVESTNIKKSKKKSRKFSSE